MLSEGAGLGHLDFLVSPIYLSFFRLCPGDGWIETEIISQRPFEPKRVNQSTDK